MTDVLTLPLFVFSCLYFILVIVFTWGWKSKSTKSDITNRPKKFVSVIIATRNEEKNLPALFNSLLSQNYPKDLFEVIVCDDASEDNTAGIAEMFSRSGENITIIKTPAGGLSGKKQALKRGYMEAKGEFIITTDADCTFDPDWIQSIVDGFADSCQPVLLIGPVVIDWGDNKIFSQLQALEFMSLQGSTGGASNIGLPIMCNGANLAITRQAWLAAKNQIRGDRYESGDDIFLLQAIKKLYPGKIHFLKNHASVVTTKPSKNIKEFLSQRMRWAGKSAGYTDLFTLLTGSIIAVYSILLSIWTLTHLTSTNPLSGFAFIALKMIIDFPLMLMTSRFFRAQKLMLWYPLLAIIYPFYVTIILISSILLPNNWKNRSIKKGSNT